MVSASAQEEKDIDLVFYLRLTGDSISKQRKTILLKVSIRRRFVF